MAKVRRRELIVASNFQDRYSRAYMICIFRGFFAVNSSTRNSPTTHSPAMNVLRVILSYAVHRKLTHRPLWLVRRRSHNSLSGDLTKRRGLC